MGAMQVLTFAALLFGADALGLARVASTSHLGTTPGARFMRLESDGTMDMESKTLVDMFATHGCMVRTPEEWKQVKKPHFPEGLRNKNIIFYGDSVDRCSSRHLCEMFGAELEAPWMNGQKLPFDPMPYQQMPYHVCNLKEYGSTVMYRAHAGAMSTKKEDNWHSFARVQEMACLHRWGDYRDNLPPPLNQEAKAPLKCQVEPAWDLAEHYVLKNMLDALPERPTILMVQSSLWDSTFAGKLLEKKGRPYNFWQADLGVQGWKPDTDGISAWDWDQYATLLLKQARWESGIKFEKTIWRTNSNCPAGQYGELKDFENWVDWGNDAMANVARDMVTKQQGPWEGVYLMDWRNHLDARSKNLCDGIHYQLAGYDNYVETLFKTIDRAYKPDFEPIEQAPPKPQKLAKVEQEKAEGTDMIAPDLTKSEPIEEIGAATDEIAPASSAPAKAYSAKDGMSAKDEIAPAKEIKLEEIARARAASALEIQMKSLERAKEEILRAARASAKEIK